jgi:hypothetical protein
MQPYKFGVIPAAGFPTACTERVRAYVRAYIKMAFNTASEIADNNALSMWMSQPLSDILIRPKLKLYFVPMSIHDLRYLRKAFIPVLAKLLHGPLATALLGSPTAGEWLHLHDVHLPLPLLHAALYILLHVIPGGKPRPLAVLLRFERLGRRRRQPDPGGQRDGRGVGCLCLLLVC